MGVTRSHTYTFSLFGSPTLTELIGELGKAAQLMGDNAKVRISVCNDQREGYSIKVTGQ